MEKPQRGGQIDAPSRLRVKLKEKNKEMYRIQFKTYKNISFTAFMNFQKETTANACSRETAHRSEQYAKSVYMRKGYQRHKDDVPDVLIANSGDISEPALVYLLLNLNICMFSWKIFRSCHLGVSENK